MLHCVSHYVLNEYANCILDENNYDSIKKKS